MTETFDRWIAGPVMSTTWDEHGKSTTTVQYVTTDSLGDEVAAHPLFDDEHTAQRLADALNALGWDEDDYFDRARQIHNALDAERLDRYVQRHMRSAPPAGWIGRLARLLRVS